MRPVPIPDGLDADPAVTRMVIAGPDGDLTGEIRPVEALVDVRDGGSVTVLIELDEEDRAAAAAGRQVWLRFMGRRIAPFAIWFDGDA